MSGYIGNTPVPQSTQVRETFIATASQTSFATAGYTPGFIDVYLNGVKLINGTDFTASNGSDVVLTTGATVSDTVEVVAYGTFETNSQTFTGVTTISELSDGTDTVETGYVINGSAKAWALFDGSGTASVDGSFNTSSLTDLGVGLFLLTWTNAMSDANYSSPGAGRSLVLTGSAGVQTASTVRVGVINYNTDSPSDDTNNSVSAHGDLA